MSDLRIYVNNSDESPQLAAPTACENDPPAASRGSRPDACTVSLPLTLEGANPPTPRQVVFDRQGDHFVLSPRNSADTLTWVSSQQNLGTILNILHVNDVLLRNGQRGRGNTSSFGMTLSLWVSRYIVTGNFEHDVPAASSSLLREINLMSMALEIFSGPFERDASLIGAVNLLRREPDLSADARERIGRFTALLDLVVPYQNFTHHFFSTQDISNIFGLRSDEVVSSYARVWHYLRRSFMQLAQHQALRYDSFSVQALENYERLFRTEIASGARPNFCAALQAAVREQTGSPAEAERLMGDCQDGFALAALGTEAALRESLRRSLVNPAGLDQLQSAVAAESTAANMRIDWLRGRSAFGQVFDSILENIQLNSPSGAGASPTLSFNFSAFRQRFNLVTSLTGRGEYDLSALAFLRRLFGSEGAPPRLRVFVNGQFQEVSWALPEESLRQIRTMISSTTTRRQSNAGFLTTGMPVVLGSTCALGVGGLVLSQTLPQITSNRSAQLGLGLTSAGLTGAGCVGLAGHYVWPAVAPREVHNRYAWDLGSSAVGSAVGIGTYLLIHFLSGGQTTNPDPGMRNPVDPFGP